MNDYPDELELEIERIAQGGDGVGRWQGRVIFARGGLPGEHIRVRLYERKTRYARGHLLELLVPSPDRVPPRLPNADHMPWQHISYPAQLRFKRSIVQEQLEKLAGIADVPVQEVLPAAHPWSYRNTAHLHADPATGAVGYYIADTHTVRDMETDPLLLPVLNDALAGLRSLLRSRVWKLEAATLRGSATYGYSVAIVQGKGNLDDLAHAWRARVPTLAAVATPDNPNVTLHEKLGGVVFSLSPASFFQTHTAQAEVMFQVMCTSLQLQSHERLLDAYSGVGTFALPLAQYVQQVLAIESHPQSVQDGEKSARMNDIDNVHFITAAVERSLSRLDTPVDAVILDPPRRGCHPAVLDTLAALAPARIVYVSCHPGILARDLQALLSHGYQLRTVQPVDLFPQTPHIESVVVLER